MYLPSQPHLACCLSSPLLLLYIIGTNISEYVYSFQCFLAFLIVEFPLWTYYIKQRSHKNIINCTLLNLSTWCTPKSVIDMDCMPVDTHFFFFLVVDLGFYLHKQSECSHAPHPSTLWICLSYAFIVLILLGSFHPGPFALYCCLGKLTMPIGY